MPLTLSFDVGIVNLAYCLIQLPEGNVLDWDIICLAEEGEKAKRIPLEKLGGRLFARLDTIWEQTPNIHTVLIENQPSRLNGHMKSVQMMIYSYFVYKQCPETLLVNASGKLKTHEEALKALTGTCVCPYEDGYRQNKWWSIQICQYYIRNDTGLCEKIQANKKKDDLCDALLQAIGWFHKKNKGRVVLDTLSAAAPAL
jgi:hypothetical protein